MKNIKGYTEHLVLLENKAGISDLDKELIDLLETFSPRGRGSGSFAKLSKKEVYARVLHLLDQGARPDAMETSANGLVCRSVLHAAAGKGLTDVVKLLLDRGADVNGRDCHGFTALHSAMFTPIISEKLVKLLIKRGADVNARGKDGSTPLHYGSGSWVASLLMKFGADPNIKNKDGQRPVDISIQNTFGVGNASLIKDYVIHGVHLKTIFDDPDDAEGYFQGDLGWLPPESESSKWIKKVNRARGAFGRF